MVTFEKKELLKILKKNKIPRRWTRTMTTINIYENTTGEDSILQSVDELKIIKELLENVLEDNKKLNHKINGLKIELTNNQKLLNEVLSTINNPKQSTTTNVNDDSKTVGNEKITKVLTSDNTKDLKKEYGLTDLQVKILDTLPVFTVKTGRAYEKYIQKQYLKLDAKGRELLLNDAWTLNRLMDAFNEKRWDIEKSTIKTKKSLIEYGLIKCFRVDENNQKSLKILYRIEPVVKKDTDSVVGKSEDNHTGRIRKDKDKFEILQKEATRIYNNLQLKSDGTITQIRRNSNYEIPLKFNIYDVLYINDLSSRDNFTFGDFKNILKWNEEWTRLNVSRLIFNLRENKDMQNILTVARDKLVKDIQFSNQGDLLFINDENTHITVKQARNWCLSYVNSNKSKDEFMWTLQRRFPEINKDAIAVILYNNTNNELTDLWSEDSKVFIENNPSKRQNLIMNGGLL